MQNIIDELSEDDRSQLVLSYLKHDEEAEFKFWLDYWQRMNIIDTIVPVIKDDYKKITMSGPAFTAFRLVLSDDFDENTRMYDAIRTHKNKLCRAWIHKRNPVFYIKDIHYIKDKINIVAEITGDIYLYDYEDTHKYTKIGRDVITEFHYLVKPVLPKYKNLTDLLNNEDDVSQLSLARLDNTGRKEFEFWFDYWRKNEIETKDMPTLNREYNNIIFPFAAFVAFSIVVRSKDKFACPTLDDRSIIGSDMFYRTISTEPRLIVGFIPHKKMGYDSFDKTSKNDFLYRQGKNGEPELDINTPYYMKIVYRVRTINPDREFSRKYTYEV